MFTYIYVYMHISYGYLETFSKVRISQKLEFLISQKNSKCDMTAKQP